MANQLKTVFFDRYLRFTMVMQHDKGCNKDVDMNTVYSKMVNIYYILQRNFMKVYKGIKARGAKNQIQDMLRT